MRNALTRSWQERLRYGGRWVLMAGCLTIGLVAVGSAGRAVAADQLVTSEGTMFGTITDISPDAIDFDGTRGGRQKISVADIVMVQFGDEPRAVTDAKRLLLEDDYAAALAALAGVETADLDEAVVAIRAEGDYVRAAATAGQPPATGTELPAAQQLVEGFLDRYSRTIHRYAMLELAGRLALAAGDVEAAIARYQELASGPPAVAIRAARLEGDALLGAGQPQEATAAFQRALAIRAGDAASQREKWAAELGVAGSLVTQQRPVEAVAAIRQVLAAAEVPASGDRQAERLIAAGYGLLGKACLAADQQQDALVAYLTVDLVYPSDPGLHAEALAHLVALWREGGYPQRAAEARRRLEQQYPASRWSAALSADGS